MLLPLPLAVRSPFWARRLARTRRLRGVRGEPKREERSSKSLSEESVRPLLPVVVDWLEPELLFASAAY